MNRINASPLSKLILALAILACIISPNPAYSMASKASASDNAYFNCIVSNLSSECDYGGFSDGETCSGIPSDALAQFCGGAL